MDEAIITLEGSRAGPTVAVFAGVHGNELAGIRVVNYLRRNIELTAGTLHLVYGNPRAIDAQTRFVEKNLNRCFQESALSGDTYEEKRAVTLMQLLDTCDALLDLHAYNEPHGEATPFVITEENAFSLVSQFDVSYVITGIDAIEKGGTDAYMSNQGKVGICVELGAISTPDVYIDLGIATALQFLYHFGLITERPAPHKRTQSILRVQGKHIRQSEDFSFAKNFMTFEAVQAGQLICIDGGVPIHATEDVRLLFSSGMKPVGVEAYLTAVKVT